MRGTETAYAATCCAVLRRIAHTATQHAIPTLPMLLRTCYAISGTDISYAATRVDGVAGPKGDTGPAGAPGPAGNLKPYTLHPTPYTLHPTPQTVVPRPLTLVDPAPQTVGCVGCYDSLATERAVLSGGMVVRTGPVGAAGATGPEGPPAYVPMDIPVLSYATFLPKAQY
eukprot:3941336-Rhodomonas_salina.1